MPSASIQAFACFGSRARGRLRPGIEPDLPSPPGREKKRSKAASNTGPSSRRVTNTARSAKRTSSGWERSIASSAWQALLAIDLFLPDEVRFALRAVFVTRREEGPVFDAAFNLFFSRPGGEGK